MRLVFVPGFYLSKCGGLRSLHVRKSSAKVAGSSRVHKTLSRFHDVMGTESGTEFDAALVNFPSVIPRFRFVLMGISGYPLH
jgi:hypothetical protein